MECLKSSDFHFLAKMLFSSGKFIFLLNMGERVYDRREG